jgi:hypothetical protein
MPLDTNPFAPPRTVELEPPVSAADIEPIVSERSLRELARQAPLLRGAAMMAGLALAVDTVSTILQVGLAKTATESGPRIVSFAVGLPISLFFIFLARGGARHCRRLARGDRAAVEPILDMHGRYFAASGVLALIGIAVAVCAVVVGLVAARSPVAPT